MLFGAARADIFWLLFILLTVLPAQGRSLEISNLPKEPMLGDRSTVEALLPSQFHSRTVIGGVLAQPGNSFAPYIVEIDTLNGEGKVDGQCTGVIIDPKVILTAGHCLPEKGLGARVRFGLGGSRGYIKSVTSRLYVSSYEEWPTGTVEQQEEEQGNELWVNGNLRYDRQDKIEFWRRAHARWEYVNFAGFEEYSERKFFDLALIKIDGIPDGFSPIRFYTGSVPFRTLVVVAGYGVDNRKRSKVRKSLKWSPQVVIGHATPPNKSTHAFQVYSPSGASMCMGDSGGPAFILANGKVELLGLNILVDNICITSAWVNSPLHYKDFLERALKKLNVSYSI
jgi:hypothetical protein